VKLQNFFPIFFAFIGLQAQAADDASLRHEIETMVGTTSISSSTINVRTIVGYHYQFLPGFQVGTDAVLIFEHEGASTSVTGTKVDTLALAMLFGPTVNLPFESLRNAFFLRPELGFTYARVKIDPLPSATSSTKFTFAATLGKRFQVLENVSYMPTVSVTKVVGSAVSWGIQFLGMTVTF
jgi:hypothetical protein